MIPRYALTYGDDIDACIKYIPFAQNLLAHAAQSGQQVLRRQINDTDWIRVDVNKWGVSAVHIEAGSADIYMESGFYDLLSSATCTENTYKPAILHYNTPIGAYINSLDKPTQGKLTNKLEGEKLLDGYTSLSVGGKKLQTIEKDPCGNTYVSSVPAYSATPEKTLMQKQVQNRIPSSMFSGKMRLYVQALYGSPRTDYRINIGVNGLPNPGDYKLYVEDTQQKDFELVWDYPYTAGIFTTDDYKYYVMKVVTSEIHFYQLVLSSAAETIRRALITSPQISDPAFVSRIEAYLLSTGKIDTKNAFTIPIAGAVSIAGGPFAYGWKFSRSGKACTVVVHQDISPLFDGKEYRASELTVTINEADGVFNASMTVTKTGTWSHNTWFVPWVPDFYEYTQYQLGGFNTGSDMSTGLCPLYGWYEGEIYKTLDVEINISTRTDSGKSPADAPIDPSVPIAIGCDVEQNMTWRSWVYNGTNGSGSFFGLSDLHFDRISASSYQTKDYYWSETLASSWAGTGVAWNGPGNTICEFGSSIGGALVSLGYYTTNGQYYFIVLGPSDGTYRYGKSMKTYAATLRYDYVARSNASDTGKLGLVIPLLDAEACVTTYKQTTSSGSISKWTGAVDHNSGTYTRAVVVDVKKEVGGLQNYIAYGEYASYTYSHLPEFTNASAGNSQPGQPTDTGVAKIEIAPKTSGNYTQIEDAYTIREGSGTAASVSWVDTYLWGVFGVPLGGNTVVSLSSYNGASVVGHGENTGENRNGFRNHSAVGWA